jgi:tetratricopeptide (TPR) repeat protein
MIGRAVGWCVVAAALGCRGPSAGERTPTPQAEAPVDAVEALIAQGQLDAALAKLQSQPPDADNLYRQGAVWARKAESAPLPTPPPAPSPLPRGAEPPPIPEFKDEELRALELLEKALASNPGHVAAHLALAELLSPHAVRGHDREEARRRQPPPRRRGQPTPPPETPPPGPDFSPERIIQAFQAAIQGDPDGVTAIEALARFGVRVGRLDSAEWAYQELVRRQKENADSLVRYGDFLIQHKKDPAGAIAQYNQALIWRPDDEPVKLRIADIYIEMGIEHFNKGEYAVAEARFKEADRYVSDSRSPQGIKLADYTERLRAIRRPR